MLGSQAGTISGAYFGNIIFGGLIGLAVDAMTGAMFKVIPERVDVNLEKAGAQSSVEVTKPVEIATSAAVHQ